MEPRTIPRTIPEAYGSAATAGNLKQDVAHRVPVDLLTAAGMTGRRNPLGLALWRISAAHDAAEFEFATEQCAKLLMDVRRRAPRVWPGLNLAGAKEIAKEVLLCWWKRTCPKCEGRGYAVIPGTPTLSDAQCPSCHGTGEVDLVRHIGSTLGAEATDPARWLRGEIDAIQAAMEQAMRGALQARA